MTQNAIGTFILPGIVAYNLPHTFSDNSQNNSNPKPKEGLSSLTSLNNGSFRIIMADDDADDREMFAEALEKIEAKIKLDFAEDGSILLYQLENDESPLPDLIFLDLNMPKKSGKECLEMIRKNEKFKHIPVVIYSTSSLLKDIDETFDMGANLYVKKPSSFTDLVNIARTVLLIDWEKQKPFMLRSNYLFSSQPSIR